MRRSQAPSFKVKPPLLPTDEEKSSIPKCNSTPSLPEDLKSSRSTETVIDLIFNSSDSLNAETDSNKIPLSPSVGSTSECSGTKDSDIKDEICTSTLGGNSIKETNQNVGSGLTVYNVVFGKQTKKKHKTWEGDGVLEVGSKYLTLKDEDGKVLGTGPRSKARKLEEGVRLYVGSKEVELLDVVKEYHKVEKSEPTTEKKSEPTPKKKNGASRTLIKPAMIKSGVGKRFLTPTVNYSNGLALPAPNNTHQWQYNQEGLPVTPVYIEASLSSKLREHQKEGVTFLYECIMGFKDSSMTGAILADEMGLGKTLQCIALIWTLLKQGPYGNKPAVRKVLIVTPSSLVMNWHNEFIKWLGRVRLVPFCVNQKNKPLDMKGPVMIISYETLIRYSEDVQKHNFDLLICDEAHRLKNANIRATQTLQNLNCEKKILLTGTPIQNDLNEFYALTDFANPNALGSPNDFRRRYVNPFVAARQPNADLATVLKGRDSFLSFRSLTSKFLLRRSRDILTGCLPPRNEVVVFCRITDVQKQIYNSLIDSFIGCKENLLGLSDKFAPLELITALRKVCSHPCLLKNQYNEQVENIPEDVTADEPLIEMSGKVIVTVNFLKELKETSPKEKVVLVSSSTQTLDILGKIVDSIGFSSCRLDGSTPTAQRNDIVERFNSPSSTCFVFLLSAKAGGVGLNLTGASRLILFDSDWNPATDLQAKARIWRDGQKFPVFIYRLLTTGTIEEKIYQRQISKQGLCEGTIDPDNEKSIKLSNEELKDIFSSCSVEEDCLTHSMLACECSKNGEIPLSESEEEDRACQLVGQLNSPLKMCDLLYWEHHGRPFSREFLSQLCLRKNQEDISFIFSSRNT